VFRHNISLWLITAAIFCQEVPISSPQHFAIVEQIYWCATFICCEEFFDPSAALSRSKLTRSLSCPKIFMPFGRYRPETRIMRIAGD
jgi:hypothetical protein